MHEGRKGSRADDTSTLKKHIHKYVHKDTLRYVKPSFPDGGAKALRGWNHLELAHMLLPLQYTATQSLLDDINDNKLKITEHDWPRFLYPDGRIFDLDNEFEDLFRGHLLLRVMKHIYTGHSTWNQGPGHQVGKSSHAQKMGMTSVTSRAIAYAAVQARFAICSSQDWGADDRDFSNEEFFWQVVEIIDDEEDNATINYFNEKLYKPVGGCGPKKSAAERTKEQRKRARTTVPY
ncbi:hypothetical protein K474DRAFT_1666617 [Panus rudis PR-1116 ss-1]|nr:hypothetical protein K474DRAFT_1666617 [Panus rudis PR-1116 ss-1]